MTNKPRVTIFSYGFYPESFLINDLCTHLAQNAYIVEVSAGLPNYPKGEFFAGYSLLRGPFKEVYNGAQVLRHPILPRKKGRLRLALNYLSFMLMGSLNIFRLSKGDVAFVFAASPITIAIPAILWARLRGAKVCLWLQDLWPESVAAVGALKKNTWAYKIIGLIVRWIYSQVDLMMIQSPGFAANLEEFNYKGPVDLIPNWAEQSRFEGLEPTWLQNFPQGFVVTFAGNVGKAQSIRTILQAALELKNESISFAIVGDGSDRHESEAWARENKLTHVHFFGQRPSADMPWLFKKSTCLLVSLRDDAIFAKTVPAKVQAYMASGKPLIGSLNGTGAAIIEEVQCGLTSPAEDGHHLALNILKIAQMPAAQLERMGQNGFAYFKQNYEKSIILARIERSLDLLNKRP